MEPIYKFDPERFRLGTLCLHGHAWPGTTQSLRKIHPRATQCAGCTGRKGSSWLISFIDSAAMGIPKGWHIGKLCRGGHQWRGHEMTLRNPNGKCIECEQQRRQCDKYKASTAKWRTANADLLKQQERAAYEEKKKRAAEDPDYAAELRSRQAQATHRCRQKKGRASRAGGATGEVLPVGVGRGPAGVAVLARGLAADDLLLAVKEHKALWSAISQSGQCPNVARLVMNEQRMYWKENPEAKNQHDRQWRQYIYAWRYKCEPSFRRHECQRNSARRVRNSGNHTVKLCRGDIDARFADFNSQCAFCGSSNQLIIEHFIPRSKGGPHAIGNILPACYTCNMSKFNHDPEKWYRSRSYFSETRWRKILRVLGKARTGIHQLPLL
jgi:5-methylcytosine-specific restriction endonuclease McrA